MSPAIAEQPPANRPAAAEKPGEYRTADEFIAALFDVYGTMAHSPDERAIGLRENAMLQESYPRMARFLEEETYDDEIGERFLLGKLTEDDAAELRRRAADWFQRQTETRHSAAA